jgi:hypothetical protein
VRKQQHAQKNPPHTRFSLNFFFFFSSIFLPFETEYYRLYIESPQKERTKTRPLARGDVTPRHAIAFLAPQLTAGLAVLTQLNWYRYACVS